MVEEEKINNKGISHNIQQLLVLLPNNLYILILGFLFFITPILSQHMTLTRDLST